VDTMPECTALSRLLPTPSDGLPPSCRLRDRAINEFLDGAGI
jgi:hypothetical protein